ncbi:tetratricopeptide repeat-containing sensor histidine kinase [Spirosoma gilvum]
MNYTLFVLMLFVASTTNAQTPEIDSLKQRLTHSIPDTSRVKVWVQLGDLNQNSSFTEALRYGQQALNLARRINFASGEMNALILIGRVLRNQGDLPTALEYTTQASHLADSLQSPRGKATGLFLRGIIYIDLQDFIKAIHFLKQAQRSFNELRDEPEEIRSVLNLGVAYRQNKQIDSALMVFEPIYGRVNSTNFRIDKAFIFSEKGFIDYELGNYLEALTNERKAIKLYSISGNKRRLCAVLNGMADIFIKKNQPDSAIYYAQKSLASAQALGFKRAILYSSRLLYSLYKSRDSAKALYYLSIAMATNESMFGAAKVQSLQRVVLEEQERQRQFEARQVAYQNQVQRYSLLAGLAVVVLIASILYRYSRQKHRANRVLQQTLSELRTTQTQLIQREKMASLGELTAGIAHEIQNPLNFVNNFSDVSVELVAEQKEALAKGDYQEVGIIADDLSQNLQRITQNGQRASNIVRGMLEHSRTSTGERQPTDLNDLCDEYLRLVYQGVRSKDNSFNCRLEAHFTPNLPLISVLPSDLSRVLLNLFNNAFYAVGQKRKTASADYQPTVWVSAGLSGATTIEIRVRDNGTGIPEDIRAKIFQPFFTTKPTGEGTGLGLSLSYDIVTKGHGGTLMVESEENTYTEFIITLPFTEPL